MSLLPGTLRPHRPQPRALAALARDLALHAVEDVAGLVATGVAVRTQDVRAGDVFAGLPGAAVHGASFAAEAKRRGAVALLTDPAGAELARGAGLPLLVTPAPRQALGAVAAWIHGTAGRMPLLLGVTGTNGKTTTVHVIERLLELIGVTAGVSSTAERSAGDERVQSRLTTPEADELHALLARMTEQGVRAAALEVSAQALVRSRVEGLVFDVAGFTNLTHEHLDDFGTMRRYLAAKARLFEEGVSRRAVVSLDSPAGRRLAREVRIPMLTTGSSRRSSADWRVSGIAVGPDGTRFTLLGPDGERLETRTDLLGAHQAANAALALVMVLAAGHPFSRIAEALGDAGGVRMRMPGRLERLPQATDPAVYLDVAHTPDALAKSLAALRILTRGRLVVLFGADGDRDATKRAPMGRVAAELADVVLIHDHHSRFEDPQRIRGMLLAGARGRSAAVLEVPDPSAAVRVALDAAGPDGTVLWAGTGRTQYRDIAGTKRPYSFWDEAGRAVAESAGGSAAVGLAGRRSA